MIRTTLLAAVAFATIPAAANAVTYDAFTSFNGTQGAGNFYYGEIDPTTPGASGTFFAANSNCFIDNATCLQRAPNHDVPGFTKGGSPAFQYGSVNVPQDRLIVHPGNDTNQTFAFFLAPTTDHYRVSATFNVQDVNPSGVGINLIQTASNGGQPLTFTPLGVINGANPTYTFVQDFYLNANSAVALSVDNNGFYGNDSTGFNFTVTSGVPEPTAWAMLIGGFGLVGAASRRRRRRSIAVSA